MVLTSWRHDVARWCSCSIGFAGRDVADFSNEKTQCVSALAEYMLREVQRTLSRGRFDSDPTGLENALACVGNVLHVSDVAARQAAVAAGLKDNLQKFLPMMPEGVCTQSTRACLSLLQ